MIKTGIRAYMAWACINAHRSLPGSYGLLQRFVW